MNKKILQVGWMMWWRAILPLLIGGFLISMLEVNIVLLMLIFFPLSLFLLDWAGKVVAQKKYNVVATSMKIYTIPIPLTSVFVSLSNIGVGIWWRMIPFNILLSLFSFATTFLFFGLPVAEFASLLILTFLQIFIVGWVTNRVIQKLCEFESRKV